MGFFIVPYITKCTKYSMLDDKYDNALFGAAVQNN